MRILLIISFSLFVYSCQAQNNQNLQSKIVSFFKINNKDIQNCKKESDELRKEKAEGWLIENIYDQCTAKYDHFNFYRDNTLKILEKISNNDDFLIINYISDNITIPFNTKTVLKTGNKYYGIRHYSEYKDDKFVDKNEEFEVNKFDKENVQKIDEYLKTGKSEYISNKSIGLIGINIHWHIVARNNGKIRTIDLFRIK